MNNGVSRCLGVLGILMGVCLCDMPGEGGREGVADDRVLVDLRFAGGVSDSEADRCLIEVRAIEGEGGTDDG